MPSIEDVCKYLGEDPSWWVEFKPKKIKYLFGCRQFLRHEAQDVPCPNCGAPNDYSGWLPNHHWKGMVDYLDPVMRDARDAWQQAPVSERPNWRMVNGVDWYDDKSKFELQNCDHCDAPTLHFPNNRKSLWWYRKTELPPGRVYSVDQTLQMPTFFNGKDNNPVDLHTQVKDTVGWVFQNRYTDTVERVEAVGVDCFWNPMVLSNDTLLTGTSALDLGIVRIWQDREVFMFEHWKRIDDLPDYKEILVARASSGVRGEEEAKLLMELIPEEAGYIQTGLLRDRKRRSRIDKASRKITYPDEGQIKMF